MTAVNEFLTPRSIAVNAISETHAKVVLEPLERGFGHTLGTALRRILLSSMPGCTRRDRDSNAAAMCFQKAGLLPKAEKLFRKALQLAADIASPTECAGYHGNLSELYHAWAVRGGDKFKTYITAAGETRRKQVARLRRYNDTRGRTSPWRCLYGSGGWWC